MLVSFAQPFSDHLVGLRVRRATGLPWVAHFSDPWTDSPYLRGARWQQSVWKRLEADVVQGADALVFVNAQTAERVMRKYPDEWRRKAHVVPHGFDLDEPPAAAAARDERLTIVHTGRFYDGVRTPESLLRAVAVLSRRQPLARALRVVFVGTPIPSHRRLATSLGLDPVVEFTGRLPSAESARWAAAADVLLLIDAPAEENLFLPSKLDRLSACEQADPRVDSAARRIGRSRPRARVSRHRAGRRGRHRRGPRLAVAAKRDGRLARSASHDEVAKRYDIRRTAAAFGDILVQCA